MTRMGIYIVVVSCSGWFGVASAVCKFGRWTDGVGCAAMEEDTVMGPGYFAFVPA